MRNAPLTPTASHDRSTGPVDLAVGDVIYDGDSGEEHAVIVDVNDAGLTVRRGDTERYVPHALFGPWNDDSLVVRRGDAGEPDDHQRAGACGGHC